MVGNVTLLAKSHENISKNIDNSLNLVDLTDLSIVDITTAGEIITGVGNAASGAASFAYMEYAISRT